ncbi:MAG TPA: hypothetical protein VK737_01840, partial [Opitutales bacterium]|nr:hypothetical protein [Opitutales bacterium]
MKTISNWMLRMRAFKARHRRGSILVLTLAVGLGMTLMLGVLLKASVAEAKDNKRAILIIEAKNTVESATEYVMSQIKLAFDNYPAITGNYFVSNPITIPSAISSWMWNGTDITNVTVKVSPVPALSSLYIDPTNPANTFDPCRGKQVSASDVYVYSQATATIPNYATTTVYGEQAIEVRNNPLFTSAIFYDMALEFFPGPAMSITGPVHTNSDLWVAAETGLTFSGNITATGNFHVGFMPWASNWSGNESGYDGSHVYIPNGSGSNITPYIGSGALDSNTSYWDSSQSNYSGQTYTSWRQMENNRWGGNLQDAADSVPDEQVTGYNNFVFHVGNTSQNLNYAYAIIEPAQNTLYANGTANPWNLGSGENQKFERQAGLIVKVLSAGTANISTTTFVTGNITGFNSTTNTTANTAIATNEAAINTTVAGLYTTGNFTTTTSANLAISGNYLLPSTNASTTFSGNLSNPVVSTNPHAFVLVNQNQNTQSAAGNSLTGTTIANGSANSLTVSNSTGTVSNSLMEVSTRKYYSSASGSIPANTTVVSTTRYVGVAYVELDDVNSTVNATT